MNTGKHSSFWLIVAAAAAVLMMTMGLRMSLGLFVQPMLAGTTMSISQISFALAVSQLMWGVAQPITGACADRYGAWPVLFAGSWLLAAGAALTPLLPNVWGITLTLGILVAFGAGAGSFSILISQVTHAVPTHARGTASGIVNAGGSFGQFIFAPFVQGMIALPFLGWKGAFYGLAAVSLIALPLCRFLTRNNTGHASQTVQSGDTDGGQTLRQALRSAFRDRSYLLLHAGFFTCGFHIAFLVTHLPTEVSLCGLPAQVASWSLALIGISNVAGSLIIGWSVGRYRSKWILFWMYGSRALLIVWYLSMPRTDWTFYLFAIGLGLTWLATVPPTASLVGKLFGTRYLATLFGLTLLTHQIGGFLGAWLGGKAIVAFGDYSWMWYADIALAALAALCNLPIKENKTTPSAKPA